MACEYSGNECSIDPGGYYICRFTIEDGYCLMGITGWKISNADGGDGYGSSFCTFYHMYMVDATNIQCTVHCDSQASKAAYVKITVQYLCYREGGLDY